MIGKIGTVIRERVFRFLHRDVIFKGSIHVSTNVKIRRRNCGRIELGNGVTLQKGVGLYVPVGVLTIGDNTSINDNNMIVCREEVRIGKGCAFGPNVLIYDHDHRFNSDGFAWDEFRTSPVIIEDGCWVGANTIILRGTHIGEGSVVGASAVVTGFIPPHSIVTASRDLQICPIEKRDYDQQ